MAKFFGVVLTITQTLIVASALAMAVALPMWSSSAVAQNDIRTSVEDGGDTVVDRTYDDKTGKLLEVVRDTDAFDPNDRTKKLRKVTTKKYDQGTRPPYETSSDEQEIILDGRKSVMRKSIRTRRTFKKNKDKRKKERDLVFEVKEEKELVGLDANGVPIYKGTRVTSWGEGYRPEKNEAWDAKTGKWLHPETLKDLKKTRARALEQRMRKEAIKKNKEEAALKDKRIRKEDIEKIKDKPDESNKELREDRRRPPKPKAEEDRIVEADEGGMLVGKSLKLSDLDGCGTFLKINWDEIMGFVSTPCPGLTGGRVATQADYLSYCNSIKRTRMHCGPPGPGTEKRIEKSGIQGMPFNAFCLKLHYNILASKGNEYNSRLAQGNLRSVFKYVNGSRKLECYYVSKEQAKSLYQQYKNIGKDPSPVKPVARAEPKEDCKPGGGLVGGVNCATERIGLSDTVNPTGNRRPRINKDRSPAFASSTDPSTGETITSVGNSDGSRTVTKTDKDGNILSREKVR